MTPPNSKDAQARWQPPHTYLAGAGSRDGIVLDGGDHLVVCWTDVVEGQRQVVRIETLPKPPGGLTSVPVDLLETLIAVDESVRALGPPSVVSSAWMRSLPIGAVLAARGALSEAVQTASSLGFDQHAIDALHASTGGEDQPDLEVEEILLDERKIEYLLDALNYVMALEEGVSPRRVIAERRHIEPVTADRRIAMARSLGFLTPAIPRKASGELTPLAERALAFMGRLLTQNRGE